MAVKLEEIAADILPGIDQPSGPLPAKPLGVQPGSDEYRQIVEGVRNQVEAHLNALRNRSALTKLALIRYYSALAVLTRARTGSVRDPSGAAMSLSGSDLAHWQSIRDEARAELERLNPTRPSGGVRLVKIEMEE